MAINLFKNHPDLEYYLNLIDWNDIFTQLKSLSHFEITADKILSRIQMQNRDKIEKDLDFLSEYLNSYDDFGPLFASNITIINPCKVFSGLVFSIPKERVFSIEELSYFALVAESYLTVLPSLKKTQFLKEYSIAPEQLSKIKQNFLNPTRQFIDRSGVACYEKHPELKKIYQEVKSIEESLRHQVQKILKLDNVSQRLQQDTYDIINERFVIPLRSDSYKSDIGTIIARSQSGQTLYVEPFELRDFSNIRLQKLAEIEAIILKLCIEMSQSLVQFFNDYQTLFAFMIEFDWLNMRAQFSINHGLSRPNLNNHFNYEFIGLYHPLITNPVKNDFSLGDSDLGLVISGPNTGGKTVFLKSIAISMIFVKIGLFVPATYAELDPVGHLFYFSHDHQNLKEGLSSFASEAKYYLELMSHLGDKNIVIIDEVFNSTSSEEASALAIAFLEELESLKKSKTKVVISTHHQVLKTFMHSKPNYISAHVGYDFECNRPTYKLLLGDPGSSLAFKVFETLSQKLGIKTHVAERAKEFLDHKQFTYESLLQDLTLKKIELAKILEANRLLQVELKNQKASLEGILYLEKEKELNYFKNKLSSIIKEAESVFNEVKSNKITSNKSLNQKLATLQSSMNQEAINPTNKKQDVLDRSHLKKICFSDVKVGNTFYSTTLNKNCKVLSLNPRKMEVQLSQGNITAWAHFSTLRLPEKQSKKSRDLTLIHQHKKSNPQIEIDCRGMRLEDFEKICEESIYNLISGEIPFLTIIHGHGNGVLKSWLRTYLKKHHPDLHWENIEGNDGCTKIYATLNGH